MEEGESVAARVVAAMDTDMAVAGLSRYVRVFDPGVFEPTASSDDDMEGLTLSRSRDVESEVGGYIVRAKSRFAWDAIVGLLTTLGAEHPESFHALMQGCRRLSNSTPEEDGFHDLMLAPEQHLHDVSVGREGRRSQQGYLSAGDARAFLQLARQPRSAGTPTNAIAAAYFRALDAIDESAVEDPSIEDVSSKPAMEPDATGSIEAVADLLAEAGVASARPRALLGPASADVASVVPIHLLMEYVHDRDEDAYFARSRELGFLANALVSGCSVHDRPFTAQEAWDAAVGICNLGLECQPDRPDTYLSDHDLVTAFEVGWKLLHEEVSLVVINSLMATLQEVRHVDSEVQRDLYSLRRALERNREAGTPWRAREALDVIATLDIPTWACLQGLLSECPVLPAALRALLDKHARSFSATAFECFTTIEQIRRVRQFVERLDTVLL